MKKLFGAIVFLSTLLLANPITQDQNFTDIYQNSDNKNKLTLMLYTAKSCPQCAYMKEKVFKDAKIADYLKKHFVILEKDVAKSKLPDGFEYFGIPTIFFVNDKGEEIGKFVGSTRAKPFLQVLQNARNESK